MNPVEAEARMNKPVYEAALGAAREEMKRLEHEREELMKQLARIKRRRLLLENLIKALDALIGEEPWQK